MLNGSIEMSQNDLGFFLSTVKFLEKVLFCKWHICQKHEDKNLYNDANFCCLPYGPVVKLTFFFTFLAVLDRHFKLLKDILCFTLRL